MEVGLRVVRGPDWKWGSQDEGEGHVGTVSDIGKSPSKIVYVQWDFGIRANYRAGSEGNFDLRIFDNAQIGTKHPNITCDVCKKDGIVGFRWKCLKCFDFDLCTQCYMSDKHDLTHTFHRFDTTSSIAVEIPKRQGSAKVKAKGIFTGARVKRGRDWNWGNQDGGDGKTGQVIEIRDWDKESFKSAVRVTWATGTTNVYRLGHKGKMDVKYSEEADDGHYYKDHLPLLGKPVEDRRENIPIVPLQQFSVGEKVQVLLDVEILKALQGDHGGWVPRMEDAIGKIGTVFDITTRGDVGVRYDSGIRWIFHPAALIKVTAYSVGDVVKIINDVTKVKELQKGHGEWVNLMELSLGKNGKITKIDSDGDLRVNVDGMTWTFNPLCVTLMSRSATEDNNTTATNEGDDDSDTLLKLFSRLLSDIQKPEVTNIDRLVAAAAKGHRDQVKEILNAHPEKVDHKTSGTTALQVSCHEGHIDVVRLLLSYGPNIEETDDDGDTALHYSVIGNQPEIMELLLKKGAPINCVNKNKCSPLHVSVNKQHINCLKVLLQYKCNVNMQDSYGDTALHDAIGKDNEEIIKQLVNVPEIDFSLENKRGFNALHHAALKGSNKGTEILLSKSRQIVDVKKDDGFAALHIAAFNGHYQVAKTLITQGMCEVDIQNKNRLTPLQLAITQGYCSVVELLLSLNASVQIEDDDGDTCLHLAIMYIRTSKASAPADIPDAPSISQILSEMGTSGLVRSPGLAMACLLVQKGADLQHKNHSKKTPLDLITDGSQEGSSMAKFLQDQTLKKRIRRLSITNENTQHPETHSESNQEGVENIYQESECLICRDVTADVVFEPCGHRIICQECSVTMKKIKKCITCHKDIIKKEVIGQKINVRVHDRDARENISEQEHNEDTKPVAQNRQNVQERSQEETNKIKFHDRGTATGSSATNVDAPSGSKINVRVQERETREDNQERNSKSSAQNGCNVQEETNKMKYHDCPTVPTNAEAHSGSKINVRAHDRETRECKSEREHHAAPKPVPPKSQNVQARSNQEGNKIKFYNRGTASPGTNVEPHSDDVLPLSCPGINCSCCSD